MGLDRDIYGLLKKSYHGVLISLIVLLLIPVATYIYVYTGTIESEDLIPAEYASMDDEDGLIKDKGYEIVVANCTSCHSARLVTQNRATRAGWERTIRWMQKTQNLWDLGDNEGLILDYLSRNYAPEQVGRRRPLDDISWYSLKQ